MKRRRITDNSSYKSKAKLLTTWSSQTELAALLANRAINLLVMTRCTQLRRKLMSLFSSRRLRLIHQLDFSPIFPFVIFLRLFFLPLFLSPIPRALLTVMLYVTAFVCICNSQSRLVRPFFWLFNFCSYATLSVVVVLALTHSVIMFAFIRPENQR